MLRRKDASLVWFFLPLRNEGALRFLKIGELAVNIT
jgi:hypothetical protein